MRMKHFAFGISVLSFCLQAFANNVSVSNVELVDQNTNEKYVNILFDLSWDNSFRDDVNHDAVWIFIKYQETGSSTWGHGILNGNSSLHNLPSGFECTVGITGSDGMGCFIFRDSNGNGTNTLDNVKLRWQYGDNALPDNLDVIVKVFAIEMIYVPEGSFWLGDLDADVTGAFRLKSGAGAVNVTPAPSPLFTCLPTSYDDSQLQSIGITVDGDDGLDSNGDGTIDNSSFPTGYSAFYCMKYEISEGQWVDFFNTLSSAEKANRDITATPGKGTDATVYRNTVAWNTGDAQSNRPDRACSYLSWGDAMAYADWAGLRPMTELEFEKAARGTEPIVDDEFAWGSTTIVATKNITGTEDGTEVADGNCSFEGWFFNGGDGNQGPLRCGIYATSSSTQETAGAGYYGIMQLSGNLHEHIISVGHTNGRAFTGVHGDGQLDINGDANVINWPVVNGDAYGAGLRGGSWRVADENFVRLASRQSASNPTSDRLDAVGFRAVRSAP